MMQRIFRIVLLIASTVLIGCGTQPVTRPTAAPAAGTSRPTLVPSATASPSEAIAAATSTTAPTRTAAIPSAAPTTVPTMTSPAPAATPSPSAEGLITFTSQRLGIRFTVQARQDSQGFAVQESGDKVYVYMENTAPETGQWVQVFQKPAGQSLEDAIRQQVLQGYSPQDCPVEPSQNPVTGEAAPSSYTYAVIKVPIAADDTPETIQAKARKCPQPYAAVGGIAYFLADAQHPDRFLFFSIGQYAIPGEGGQPWQDTVVLLDQTSPAASGTAIPTATPSGPAGYLDDRSSPESTLASYINALDSKQYARAYSYWSSGAASAGLPPFEQFAQGYADTAAARIAFGASGAGGAAGSEYFTVAATVLATTTAGVGQTYLACYTLRLGNPAIQAVPPFQPMSIESATLKQVPAGTDTGALLPGYCLTGPNPAPTAAPAAPGDIGPSRYIDNRSGPVEVLQSLFNAINRREYARAYSYWGVPAGTPSGPPSFDSFQQGYADTRSVRLETGTVKSDVGAGQLYYSVPVVLLATTSEGAEQAYVGCYTLHLARPEIQAVPPFRPLGIEQAQVHQVESESAARAQMPQACP